VLQYYTPFDISKITHLYYMKALLAIFPILVILLTSFIVPYSFASVESEAQEDIQAGCRDGQTMVFRYTNNEYVCVSPDAADRWSELGLAKIISESNEYVKKEIPVIEPAQKTKFPEAPPPKTSTFFDHSECRDGYVLIHRFIYHDTFCTSMSTATTWERLGISEFVNDEKSNEITIESNVEQEQSNVEQEQSNVEQEQSNVEQEQSNDTFESNLGNDFNFPIIKQIDDNIWFIIDYDDARSVIIEGSNGLIVIDPLNSYESVKTSFEEFKYFSDKPVKTIIFTKITPDILRASDALIEEGDGSVEMVITEDLSDSFFDDYEIEIPNSVLFSSKLSIDISNIQMELVSGNYGDSYQTYIFIPSIDGVVIGDSDYGMMPFLLEMSELESLVRAADSQ